MQTDELRAELTDLANEVEPFAGDVSAVRRRVARRRTVAGSIAAVIVVVLAGSAIAITRSNPHRLEVAGSTKEVRAADLPRVDAAVVMPVGATEGDVSRVQRILDTTDAVSQYAEPPAGSAPFAILVKPKSTTPWCAAPAIRGFVVALARTPDAIQHLRSAVGSAARVIARAGQVGDYDVELFMQVHAPAAQVLALEGLLAHDPNVAKYQFLNHRDAYQEFKRLFADQPTLIKNETPAGLPESFRVLVRDGASRDAVVKRYEHQPGVDQVNYSANPFADPQAGTAVLPCEKTP